jgi:hypothetical protein
VLGGSDCEALRDGLLAQPVNAVSSLSYAVVGGWLLAGASRAPARERPVQAAYGVCLIATGLGSVGYHGPMQPGARLGHDLPIVALLLLIAADNLTALGILEPRTALWLAGVGAAGAGLLLAIRPDAFALLGAAAAGCALITAAAAWRVRRIELDAHRRSAYRTALALLGAGLALNVLGRTGAPLCWPTSPFQPHAAWHLLSAAAAGLYVVATRSRLPRP